MFNTPAQQYAKHLLITAFLTFAAGFGTLLWQFVTSHPFDIKTILAAALVALGISGSHAMLTLGTSDAKKELVQAFLDTYNQVTTSHLSLAEMFKELIAALTSQTQTPQAPIVQVNTAPTSAGQPAQVVENVAPPMTVSTPSATATTSTLTTPQQPVQSPVMPTTLGDEEKEFTAPVLPVVK